MEELLEETTVQEQEKEYESSKAQKRYNGPSSASNKIAPMKARRSANMNLGSGLEVCVKQLCPSYNHQNYIVLNTKIGFRTVIYFNRCQRTIY